MQATVQFCFNFMGSFSLISILRNWFYFAHEEDETQEG